MVHSRPGFTTRAQGFSPLCTFANSGNRTKPNLLVIIGGKQKNHGKAYVLRGTVINNFLELVVS